MGRNLESAKTSVFAQIGESIKADGVKEKYGYIGCEVDDLTSEIKVPEIPEGKRLVSVVLSYKTIEVVSSISRRSSFIGKFVKDNDKESTREDLYLKTVSLEPNYSKENNGIRITVYPGGKKFYHLTLYRPDCLTIKKFEVVCEKETGKYYKVETNIYPNQDAFECPIAFAETSDGKITIKEPTSLSFFEEIVVGLYKELKNSSNKTE